MIFRLILLCVILSINTVFTFQVIDKVLDKLYYKNSVPSNNYWIEVLEGQCSVGAEYVATQSSLAINYQFRSKSKSDFFQVLSNFDKNTRSFSCRTPFGMSLMIKSEGSDVNNDVLKFMLTEDADKNGILDGDDAIFAFSYPLSGLKVNSNWFQLDMSYDKFQIWYTNGKKDARKPSLEKVRAWSIAVFNENVNQQANRILVKDLKIACVAQPLAGRGITETIKSSFIQLWNDAGCACGEWALSRWITEFGRMSKINIKRLIVQYSVYDSHSWYQNGGNGASTLDKIMMASEFQPDFKVVFGLYFDEKWNWQSKYDASVYDALYLKHTKVIDDIYQRFGSKKQFGGFYIPQEWNNVEWKNDESMRLLGEWTRKVVQYAKSKDANAPVLVAPFFRSSVTKELTAELYERYLTIVTNSNTGPFIDEILPQDSHGVEEPLTNTLFDVYTYFEAIKAKTDKFNTKLGMTVEVFQQSSTTGTFTAKPANIKRIVEQINIANYVTKSLTQFEWGYMMANNYELYNSYQSQYFNY